MNLSEIESHVYAMLKQKLWSVYEPDLFHFLHLLTYLLAGLGIHDPTDDGNAAPVVPQAMPASSP